MQGEEVAAIKDGLMGRPRQILALGGGGFLVHHKPTPLDDFLLSLAASSQPKICFVATAMGDSPGVIERFYAAFEQRPCSPTHLPLFQRDGADPRDHLLSQDIVFVSGGNTVNLLAVWRAHGVDVLMREAYDSGVILAGISAGALCWFEGGTTDSFGPLVPLHDGLGLVSGSVCPHYSLDLERRPVYHAAINAGLQSGLAIDDGAAAHFVEGELQEVVSETLGATAHRVQVNANGEIAEEPLPARYLGTAET